MQTPTPRAARPPHVIRLLGIALLAATLVLPQAVASAEDGDGDGAEQSLILSPIDQATVAGDRMPVRIQPASEATAVRIAPVTEPASVVEIPLSLVDGELRGLATGLVAGQEYEAAVLRDDEVLDTSGFAVVDMTVRPTRVDLNRSEPLSLTGDQPVALSGVVWPGHVDKEGDAGHPGLGYVARLVDLQDVTFGLGARTAAGTVPLVEDLQLTLPAADRPGGLMPIYTQLNLLEPRAPKVRTPAVEFEIALPIDKIAEYVQASGVTDRPLDDLVIWVEPSDVMAEGMVPTCTDLACDSMQLGEVKLPLRPYASADPTPVYIAEARARDHLQRAAEGVLGTVADDDPSYDSLRKAAADAQDEALRSAGVSRFNGTNYLVSFIEVVDDTSEVIRDEWDRVTALTQYPATLVDANPGRSNINPLGTYAVTYADGLPYPVTPDLVAEACKDWNFCSPAEADAAEAFWNSPMERRCVDAQSNPTRDNCYQMVYAIVDHDKYLGPTYDMRVVEQGVGLGVRAYMFNGQGLWGGDYEELGYAFKWETDGFWEKDYWGGGWSYVKTWRDNLEDPECHKEYNYGKYDGVSNYPSGSGYSPNWGTGDSHTRQVGNVLRAGEQFKKGSLKQSWFLETSPWGTGPRNCEYPQGGPRVAVQWAYTHADHDFSDAHHCGPREDCSDKERDGLIGMRFVHRKRSTNWSMTCGGGIPAAVGCTVSPSYSHEEAWDMKPVLPFLYYDVDDF